VGIGSNIFIKKEDGSFDYNAITEKLRSAIQIVENLRK